MKNMSDIAKALKLSRLTVSSVINGKADERRISEATCKRVWAYLNRIGYVPSRHATALRHGPTHTVGIIYCGLLYSHLIEAYNRLSLRFLDEGVSVETFVHPGASVEAALREMVGGGIKRLVWMQTNVSPVTPADLHGFSSLLKQFEVVVAYNADLDCPEMMDTLLANKVHVVGVRRSKGFAQLARMLKKLGHRHVTCPELPFGLVEECSAPVITALQKEGLRVYGACEEGVLYARDAAFGDALAEGIQRLQKAYPITAACLGDDEIAGHTMAALRVRGVRIPEDMSVTGFDGMSFGSALSVPLTTLQVPVPQMVAMAGDIMTHPERVAVHEATLELVARKSHGKASIQTRRRSKK